MLTVNTVFLILYHNSRGFKRAKIAIDADNQSNSSIYWCGKSERSKYNETHVSQIEFTPILKDYIYTLTNCNLNPDLLSLLYFYIDLMLEKEQERYHQKILKIHIK